MTRSAGLADRLMAEPARSRALSVVALELLALGVVYGVALGTPDGLTADSRAVLDVHTAKPWAAHWTVSDQLHVVTAASFALMGAAVAAMRRRDAPRLAAAALLVVGSAATAQLLKPVLAEAALFDPDSVHALDRSFPSGHAATALALGLALLDAAPAGWRRAAAAFALLCATAIGIGLMTLGWHYPSDIAGGFLIAGAWAAATSGGPRAHAGEADPPRLVLPALALAAVGCVAFPAVALSHLVDGRVAPPAFGAGAVAVAGCAAAVTVATASLRGTPRRGRK